MAVTYEDFDFQQLLTYGGIDSYVTYELFKKLYPEVAAKPLYKVQRPGGLIEAIRAPSIIEESLEIKKDALQFMIDLKVNGLLYDQALHAVYEKQMVEHLSMLQERIFSAVGEPFNLSSTQECERILFGKFGFTTEVRTKTGSLSTSGDALKEMFKQYGVSWLKDMAIFGDIDGMYLNFIKDYIQKYVKRDGRIHANYNLHGTSSHRISGDKPNMLNLPRPKHGYNLRRLFKVKDGYVFLTFDFSSCEVKVLAALCKDEKMIEAILQGLDFHSYTASMMYNIPYEELCHAVENEDHPRHKEFKGYRQNAKAVTLDT